MERKPARRRSEIPPEILGGLNAGTLSTANLVEGLAMDLAILLRSVAPTLSEEQIALVHPDVGYTQRMILAARLLREHHEDAFERFRNHPSDTVRGWAAFVLAEMPNIDFRSRLLQMRQLADDPHFAVREWAWLALRPHLEPRLTTALAALKPWTRSSSANIRRFAIEITRPRGVWCKHLDALKKEPQRARALLEALKADPSKYVQTSVSNWLNDASKTQPRWVQDLCASWRNDTPDPATVRICQRALRSIEEPT